MSCHRWQQAPVADGNPAIGRGVTPRAPCTYYTPPPRTDATGVANSGELGLPLPCFNDVAITPTRHHSLSPLLYLRRVGQA